MSNWVQKDAAELLSISPRVMNYKIKTLGIEFPRGRRRPTIDGRRTSAKLTGRSAASRRRSAAPTPMPLLFALGCAFR